MDADRLKRQWMSKDSGDSELVISDTVHVNEAARACCDNIKESEAAVG